MTQPKVSVRFEFQSGPLAARQAMEKLMQSLSRQNLDSDYAGKIELVLSEAINNVVEHAYPEEGPNGPILVECIEEDGGFRFLIIDQGQGMPDGDAPEGKPASVNVGLMDLPEGGFGWFLIRDLADDVEYKRIGWENHLSLKLSSDHPH